jgi:hypothetical protein
MGSQVLLSGLKIFQRAAMYTKRFFECPEAQPWLESGWLILDPHGNQLCAVYSESEAITLLLHLNRC